MSKDKIKYNEKQQRFVDYVRSKFPYIDSETYKDARAYAGYHEAYPVDKILHGLRDLMEEEIKEMLAHHGLEAAGKQVQIMRNPSKEWRAEMAASNNILEKMGIGKKDEDILIAPVGLVLMPAKKTDADEEQE
jgi:hypothetical protein